MRRTILLGSGHLPVWGTVLNAALGSGRHKLPSAFTQIRPYPFPSPESCRALPSGVSAITAATWANQLTSVDILGNVLRQRALHSLLGRLRAQLLADGIAAAGIEGTLKRVALPTEHVVAVLGVSDTDVAVQSELVLTRASSWFPTYESTVLQTNGCEPSSGQSALSLNSAVWSCQQMS